MLSVSAQVDFANQILEGMAFLESKQVVHSNLSA